VTTLGSSAEQGWFAELGDDVASVGGKAHGLAALAAAGLPTPRGFAVTDVVARGLLASVSLPAAIDATTLAAVEQAGRAIDRAAFPPGFAEAVARRSSALGATRFAVRSSFATEDAAGALAAGVYESRVDVAAADVPEAIRAVVRSAVSAGAVAYALARGRAPASPPVAVLVHEFEHGVAHGHAAAVDEGVVVDLREGAIDDELHAEIVAGVRRVASAHGNSEVEWVARAPGAGPRVRFLQLRPYVAPPAPQPWRGWAELPSGEDPSAWRWDAAHNPAPRAGAPRGRGARAAARCRIGYRQRVLGGYLFYRADAFAQVAPLAPADARRALELLEHQLGATVERGSALTLEDALALFVSAYEPLLGPIGGAVRAARTGLVAALVGSGGATVASAPAVAARLLAGVESAASRRARAAGAIAAAPDVVARAAAIDAYLAAFGDEADAWDVAAPCWRERPDALVAVAASARAPASEPLTLEALAVWPTLAASAQDELASALAAAREAAAVGEDDDALYARLQAIVRRALLDVGARAVAAGVLARAEDVFDWPLSVAREVASGASLPADGASLAAAGHAARARATADPPPALGAAPSPGALAVRGAGTGGRCIGRVVHRHGRAGARPPADAVLVARALLPTELPLLRVAALVTEAGGPLDHVSAQARERGLPAVVGAIGACASLPEGARVLVDADAGLVVRL
jgi:pyruvate,water dikinase